MIMIDEAWVMLGHPVFREKFREWLKVMRKNNCLVVAATQSLSDAYNSGVFDVMLESCPTKILLPNEEADKAGSGQILGPRDIYAAVGLNDAEITIIQHAHKKRDYYAVSSHGRRLFELGLGPIALAFLGASSKEDIARVKALKSCHGPGWTSAWLEEKGIDHALSA
jgi:type IV secretion system protein VirB4